MGLSAERPAATGSRWVNLSPAYTADILREHYVIEIRCDHDAKRDKVFCNCSLVDLGWHDSVGDAVASWVSHVIDELAAATREGAA